MVEYIYVYSYDDDNEGNFRDINLPHNFIPIIFSYKKKMIIIHFGIISYLNKIFHQAMHWGIVRIHHSIIQWISVQNNDWLPEGQSERWVFVFTYEIVTHLWIDILQQNQQFARTALQSGEFIAFPHADDKRRFLLERNK